MARGVKVIVVKMTCSMDYISHEARVFSLSRLMSFPAKTAAPVKRIPSGDIYLFILIGCLNNNNW